MEIKDFPEYILYPNGAVFSKKRKQMKQLRLTLICNFIAGYALFKDGKEYRISVNDLLKKHYSTYVRYPSVDKTNPRWRDEFLRTNDE